MRVDDGAVIDDQFSIVSRYRCPGVFGSRRLGKAHPTGVCPAVLVETSGRRIERDGIIRTTAYYTKKEWQRQLTARRNAD